MTEPTTRDLLSSHMTLATVAGTTARPCRFRTALCPDQCGHATETLDFDIVKYLEYIKPGQYGDEQQKRFFFDLKKGQGQGPASSTQEHYTQTGSGLAVGDYVLLDWVHEYVHEQGAKYPERPVTKMERITAEQAAALQQ